MRKVRGAEPLALEGKAISCIGQSDDEKHAVIEPSHSVDRTVKLC